MVDNVRLGRFVRMVASVLWLLCQCSAKLPDRAHSEFVELLNTIGVFGGGASVDQIEKQIIQYLEVRK